MMAFARDLYDDAAAVKRQRHLPEQIVGAEVGGKVVMGLKVAAGAKAVVELTAEGSLTAGYCCLHPG